MHSHIQCLARLLEKADKLRAEGKLLAALEVLLDDDHDCHASEDDGCDHPSHKENGYDE